MLELFLFVGLGLVVTVFVTGLSIYARLWHWIFDRLDARHVKRMDRRRR